MRIDNNNHYYEICYMVISAVCANLSLPVLCEMAQRCHQLLNILSWRCDETDSKTCRLDKTKNRYSIAI